MPKFLWVRTNWAEQARIKDARRRVGYINSFLFLYFPRYRMRKMRKKMWGMNYEEWNQYIDDLLILQILDMPRGTMGATPPMHDLIYGYDPANYKSKAIPPSKFSLAWKRKKAKVTKKTREVWGRVKSYWVDHSWY